MKPSTQLLSLLPLTRIAGALLGEPAQQQQQQQQQPLVSQPQSPADHNGGSSTKSGLPFATVALEAYIEDAMERWHAPGLAISVVNGNETWAKGFGLATLDPPTEVTPHTLFFTGSTSKSFTAAGLSLLVDNSSDYGSVQWDTPISRLLREDFVLSDDWATEHITIEDALCHRTGYPRHDLSIANDTVELIRSFRHLPLSAEPRTKFQYNNMMYATAGYLITHLTGLDLGAFFRRHLWAPMGMHETFLGEYDPALPGSGLSAASGYWWVGGGGRKGLASSSYVRMPNVDARVDEGAGAVLSNVLDYARYLRVMMTEAGPLSKTGHRELKRPRTFHDFNQDIFVGPVTYGLAWMSGILENELVYYHTGTVSTFRTFMVIVPSRGWAITVMTNSDSRVRELVTYRALYDLFGVEEARRRDFETLFRDAEKAEQRALETCAETAYPRVANPPLPASKPLASHTGVYVHPAYDRVLVSLDCDETGATAGGAVRGGDEGCRLVFARGPESQVQLGGNLRHVSGDFWLAYLFFPETPDMVQGCVRTEFRVDAGGSVTHIGVDMRVEESHAPLVWFERTGQ